MENNKIFSININQLQVTTRTTEVKCQNKILFDELFIKMYNKIYNNYGSNETSSSNILIMEPSDSLNSSSKEKASENTAQIESKKIFHWSKFLPR